MGHKLKHLILLEFSEGYPSMQNKYHGISRESFLIRLSCIVSISHPYKSCQFCRGMFKLYSTAGIFGYQIVSIILKFYFPF